MRRVLSDFLSNYGRLLGFCTGYSRSMLAVNSHRENRKDLIRTPRGNVNRSMRVHGYPPTLHKLPHTPHTFNCRVGFFNGSLHFQNSFPKVLQLPEFPGPLWLRKMGNEVQDEVGSGLGKIRMFHPPQNLISSTPLRRGGKREKRRRKVGAENKRGH